MMDENKTREQLIARLKQAEQDKAELQAQLLQAQKMESIGQLTGGIAHDFNNMLMAIMMHLQLMESDEGDSLKTRVERIKGVVERAAGLTHRLLAFGRKQIINPRPMDINALVDKEKDLIGRLIGDHISVEVSLADGPLPILADRVQMEQILMNLATNARDSMPKGGSLFITTEAVSLDQRFQSRYGYGEPGNYACITVRDTGTGMSEETRKKVFEPFFTTKEVGKGTGLGLSVVYGIVKQHSSYINVSSELGKGTEFKVYLPRLESTEITVEEESLQIEASFVGSGTILLAEDDADIRAATKTVLENFGYSVIEAVDGEDAINRFMDNRAAIKFLLLDVMMPRRSGKEAYDAIKEVAPGIKALFVSGYTDEIMSESGVFEQGFNFLSKPVTPAELLREIKRILRE